MPGHSQQGGLILGSFDSEFVGMRIGPGGPALMAWGTEVPANGASGYAKGCTYQLHSGGPGNALFVNEGSAESCQFVAK